jgi:hypothetical protein
MPLPDTAGGGTSTVVFTAYSGPNSFGPDDGAPNDGVCEVCHTITDVHKNTGTTGGAHDVAVDCRQCHEHSKGFQGEGSCTTCHNTGGAGTIGPNSRRAIIPELGYNTHHISTVADTSAACLTCHYQGDGSHKGGTVKLQDADGGVVALSGDPLTNATAAGEASTVCLSCHDESRPTDPFGDGLNPPQATTTTLWAAASHEASTSLECFSCHGSGHGSQKQGLLRGTGDYTTAANATTFYEQEEGFCFTCHDGGTASTDIAGQFEGTTINWVDDPAGILNRSLMNDRHDVQHAAASVSGAKIECADCHDPHAANSTQKLRLDPDPNDGIVPAAGARMGGGSGSDWMSEWCMDCHDNSLPTGANLPSDSLTDIADHYLNTDAHGAGPVGKVGLDSNIRRDPPPETQISDWVEGDFVPCLQCHKAHPDSVALMQDTTVVPGIRPDTAGAGYQAYAVNNLFQLVNRIYTKDGTTIIPIDPENGGTLDPFTSVGWEVTYNSSPNNFAIDGYYFCNTCHYSHMSNTNCFRCHAHGDGRF